jgi:hypothetical protein
MKLEQTITILASMLIVATALLHSFGLERMLPLYASLPEIATAANTAALAEELVQTGDIPDLAALADYQSTLPVYWLSPSETARVQGQVPDTLADRQMLADYQATLPLYTGISSHLAAQANVD